MTIRQERCPTCAHPGRWRCWCDGCHKEIVEGAAHWTVENQCGLMNDADRHACSMGCLRAAVAALYDAHPDRLHIRWCGAPGELEVKP